MSHSQKAVLKELKKGPKTASELKKELVPIIMSEKKMRKTLKELLEEGKIVREPIKSTARLGPEYVSCYALPEHRYQIVAKKAQVAEAMRHLSLKFCRNPTIEDIALKLGKEPYVVEPWAYELAPELGWNPPTLEEIEEGKRMKGEVLLVAAKILYGFEDRMVQEVSIDALERARFALENEPETVPEIRMRPDGAPITVLPKRALNTVMLEPYDVSGLMAMTLSRRDVFGRPTTEKVYLESHNVAQRAKLLPKRDKRELNNVFRGLMKPKKK